MLTYAALRSLAKERGYELVLVDMRVGCSEAAFAASLTCPDLMVCLEELRECWAFVALTYADVC
jgi:hypothetical protein